MSPDPSPIGPNLDPYATQPPPTDPFETVIGQATPSVDPCETTISHASAAAATPPPRIAHYELIREIARGGMGVVHLARDTKLDRIVALKLIKAGELADDDAIERFQVEAKAAAQLDHPGIVPVYEVGEFQGQHFMAMAFIDGGSLAKEVQTSPLPPKRAAQLMEQVAAAVHFAHTHGIVHRDLKPQNILLTKDGQPKVTDFGLAKRQGGDASLTMTGEILGTPSYMPPEQATGNNKVIGPLSDIYSLGATLYFMLTGRPPFQAATQLETMLQVVEQDPVSPGSLNRAVSVDLETICLRCLEKDPKRRYATARLLSQELQRYLAGEPIHSRPVGQLERVLRWIARKPMTAAMYSSTTLAIVLLVIGATISTLWRNAESARDEAVIARQQTEVALQGEQAARAGEEAARQELEKTKAYSQYVLNVRLAPTLWERGWIGNARQALEDCPVHLRQWEWNYLHRKLHPEVATLPDNSRRANVQVSPDGKLIASGSQGVKLSDGQTGDEICQVSSENYFRTFAFQPNGHQFVAGNDSQGSGVFEDGIHHHVIVWDIQARRQIRRIEQPAGVIRLAYNPAGTVLVAGLRNGMVRLWNAADLVEIPGNRAHPNGAQHLIFLPQGGPLATGCWQGVVKLWDPHTFEEQANLAAFQPSESGVRHKVDAPNICGMACTPDGSQIVSVVRDGTVKLWDVVTRTEISSFKAGAELLAAEFSPDGRRIALLGEQDLCIRSIATGEVMQQLPGHRAAISQFAFHPDNLHCVSGAMDGEIRLWNSVSGECVKAWQGHDVWIKRLVFSPDGRRLYSANRTGEIRIWDLSRLSDDANLHADFFAVNSSGDRAVYYSPLDHAIRMKNLVTGEDAVIVDGMVDLQSHLRFDPENQTLGAIDKDGSLRLWNLANPQTPTVLAGPSGAVDRFVFSTTGRFLAAVGRDHVVKLWDLIQGTEIASLSGHKGTVINLAFRFDDRVLATDSQDNTLRHWDTATGQELWVHSWEFTPLPFYARRTWPLRFSGDGALVMSSQNEHIRIWNTANGEKVVSIDAQDYVNQAEFSPDGLRLAYTGVFPYTAVRELPSGRELARLPGQASLLKFSPDGSRLAVTYSDFTIRLWDTSTWQELATLTGHRSHISWLQFDLTGGKLISVGEDGTVCRWIAEESLSEIQEQQSAGPRIWRNFELRRAEESQNWYTAAYHIGWLLWERPEDSSLRLRYDRALAELKQQNVVAPPHPGIYDVTANSSSINR